MLRMSTTAQSPSTAVLALYGKIAGADVLLLQQEGERHLEPGVQLTLVLDDVQFIDEAGLAVLQRWAGPHLVLRGGSPFVRALLAAEGLLTS